MKSNDESFSIVCYSFTSSGKNIGEKIKLFFFNSDKITVTHVNNSETLHGIKQFIQEDFKTKNALVFISSAGIAVRMIKNYIENKTKDPAVIVIDDMGKYTIPILSGHIGRANELAEMISDAIGSQPIITTASDSRNIEAVDLYAERNNYTITSMNDAKKITAYMVEGKKIMVYSDYEADIPLLNSTKAIGYTNAVLYSSICSMQNKISEKDRISECDDVEGLIIISENENPVLPKELSRRNLPRVILVPGNLNIGIGLRFGVSEDVITAAVKKALHCIGKTMYGINKIATIDVKKNELGLINFAKHLNKKLIFFTKEEIETVEDKFEKSGFVKKTVGVYNVSAPSAFLLGGKIILDKFKYSGVTVSVSSM